MVLCILIYVNICKCMLIYLHLTLPDNSLSQTENNNSGEVKELTLTLHGTKEVPIHMRSGQRKYNKEYNLVKNEKKVGTVFNLHLLIQKTF